MNKSLFFRFTDPRKEFRQALIHLGTASLAIHGVFFVLQWLSPFLATIAGLLLGVWVAFQTPKGGLLDRFTPWLLGALVGLTLANNHPHHISFTVHVFFALLACSVIVSFRAWSQSLLQTLDGRPSEDQQ